MKNVRAAVEEYLYSYPPAFELFQKFLQIGEVFLIGGVLREYRDKNNIEVLRDADFIIDVHDSVAWKELIEEYKPEKNHFDGYKFYCSGFLVDVWKVEDTWAYRKNIIQFDKDNYLDTLPKTVFLNLDSIIYDMNNDSWHDAIYSQAKESGILDVVLEDNPHLDLNILRSMILRRRYQMDYSEKLRAIIEQESRRNINLIERLLNIQEDRYHEEILSKVIIEEELQLIKN